MTFTETSQDRIVIGIDFGTTFSGVAWAYSGEPDEIEQVTSWDAKLNHCSDVDKAPTQLSFEEDSDDVTWGYSIPSDRDALKWFKLLLLEEQDIPADVMESAQIDEASRLQKKTGKPPIETIACYLGKLWDHSIASIMRTLGYELVEKSQFHVVITLPAIWPPYAQQRMKQAAQLSGILEERDCGETVLRFISEPEAAALATIKDLSKRSTIKSGDTIVVCDAGGGTVDLISYIIESIEPYVVKECVGGDGGLCGGVFLDENFINLIKSKVPPEAWSFVSQADERKFLNDNWEHGIKPQFENKPRSWTVDLPESCPMGAGGRPGGVKRRRTLDLTSDEILTVFDPVMKKIRTLVSFQVRTVYKKYEVMPKYIILVGGFGRSRYLFNRLADEFGPDTSVLQSRGNKPWSAICRGAVIQGLTQAKLIGSLGVVVDSRIARMSFGIMYRTEFIPGVHLECDKAWDEKELHWKAIRQMEWFITKGDDLSDKKPVKLSYKRDYERAVDSIEEDIYCCPGEPPSRNDGTGTVQSLCSIKWNRNVPFKSLPKWTNKHGRSFRKLAYDIEMTCEDGIVDFNVYFQDEKVGGCNIDLQYS